MVPVTTKTETTMKQIFGALLVATFIAPAVAQADEYYVVRDATTKKCTVVNKKPTVKTTTVVGDGTVYKTKTEAEGAMKTVKVCESAD
jgi:hypothetical protein